MSMLRRGRSTAAPPQIGRMTKFLARHPGLSITRRTVPRRLQVVHLTRLADAKPYTAPLHSGVAALRLQGLEASPAAFGSLGLSYYLPGGRAEMSAGPQEKIYVLLEGELVVELGDGARHVLQPLDSCLIEPGERREVRNESNRVATLLVVMPTAA
jgi:quercetin dioxygenase-like cupin family protein